MMKIILALSAYCFSLFAAAETKEFDMAGIGKIEIENQAGNIFIQGIDGGKTIVSANKKKFGSHCRLIIDRKEKSLSVDVKKDGTTSEPCEVNFDIKVPKKIALDLETGSGDIRVRGIQGNLEFNTGSGGIDVDGKIADLDGKTGNGNIKVHGLMSTAQVQTGNGEVKLTYIQPPTEGQLDIKCGNGSAEVFFPKNSKVKTEFTSGSGKLTNELGDSTSGSFTVQMNTGLGNLTIKKF